jgi:hypothetical protein
MTTKYSTEVTEQAEKLVCKHWDNRVLLESIGNISSTEFEMIHYFLQNDSAMAT